MGSHLINTWVPTGLRHAVNAALRATIVHKGPYRDWREASDDTQGYDHDEILNRVRDATCAVLDGKADYEQDGVPMHGVSPPSDTLSGLFLAAALEGGALSVLDFGGALGSHYLRWRKWLAPLCEMHWHVVEQAHFVAAGEALFLDAPEISFSESILHATALAPNVVLASSVLQYVSDPMRVLDALVSVDARMIAIDRTPFSEDNVSHIMAQHVPQKLGKASYPVWLFAREEIHARLRERYTLLAEFESADARVRWKGVSAKHLGSLWLRKE